jgi:hypothetical protein
MLDVYIEEENDADATVSIIIFTENMIKSDVCKQEAFIFQVEGNFCLDCWQDRTEPNIA